MRSKLGLVLIFLGALLLGVAVLDQTYAVPRLEVAPLTTDATTELSGTAQLAGPDGVESFPVLVFSTTRADTSVSDGEVVSYQKATCVVRDKGTVEGCVSNSDSQKRLLTASTDEFATSRADAMAVNDPAYLSASAVPHEGLVNKWPFHAAQQDYPFWSVVAGKAVTAAYERSTEIDGLAVDVYLVELSDVPIEITEGLKGLYSERTEIAVEPTTGQIVNQKGATERTTTDGKPFLALSAAFTDEQVATFVEEAVTKKDKLDLINSTIPLVGYVGGGLLLLIGIGLLVLESRSPGKREADPRQSEMADATT